MGLFEGGNANRYALAPEVAGLRVKVPRQLRTAVRATANGVEPVLVDQIPVAHDQRRSALRAESGVALDVMHVAGVDVLQALLPGDVAGAHQGLRRCGRDIGHPVSRMEG